MNIFAKSTTVSAILSALSVTRDFTSRLSVISLTAGPIQIVVTTELGRNLRAVVTTAEATANPIQKTKQYL
jgi:hypothetical protein